MNITPITMNFAYRKPLNNSYVIQPMFVQTLDTVSFSGNKKSPEELEKNKIKGEESKEVSTKLCSEINEEVQQSAKDLHNLLKREFKHLQASHSNPDNPILPGNSGIKVRVKPCLSIRDKALSREKYSKKAIKSMGDVVGARIILQDASQKNFDKIFKVLGNMVKHGKIKIKEIENYRLTNQSSYVSQNTLDNFEQQCIKAGHYVNISNKPLPNGYTAIHITIELEKGLLAEIQIMGRNVEHLKDVEDFYYKLRCKKSFDAKYKSIEKTMKEKIKALNEFEDKALEKYIRDSYIHARELPPRRNKNTVKDFLPIPYFLPKELGFEYLYKEKQKCDEIARNQQ